MDTNVYKYINIANHHVMHGRCTAVGSTLREGMHLHIHCTSCQAREGGGRGSVELCEQQHFQLLFTGIKVRAAINNA